MYVSCGELRLFLLKFLTSKEIDFWWIFFDNFSPIATFSERKNHYSLLMLDYTMLDYTVQRADTPTWIRQVIMADRTFCREQVHHLHGFNYWPHSLSSKSYQAKRWQTRFEFIRIVVLINQSIDPHTIAFCRTSSSSQPQERFFSDSLFLSIASWIVPV